MGDATWTSIDDSIPDDGEPRLLLLYGGYMTVGYYKGGRWVIPYNGCYVKAEVLYYTDLPRNRPE